jgi:hypothetical protein
VIQLGRERCQCRLDVTKAGTVGELRVAHHKELVTAGELQGMEVSIVFVNTFVCCKNTKIFRIVPYYFTKHAQFNEKLEIIPHYHAATSRRFIIFAPNQTRQKDERTQNGSPCYHFSFKSLGRFKIFSYFCD